MQDKEPSDLRKTTSWLVSFCSEQKGRNAAENTWAGWQTVRETGWTGLLMWGGLMVSEQSRTDGWFEKEACGLYCLDYSSNPAQCISALCEGSKDQEPEEPLGQTVEPNTSRQHRYVSGQYFFEYLVVVSLKKKDGSNYEPQITYQFPKVSLSLSHHVDTRDQPEKVNLMCWWVRQITVIHDPRQSCVLCPT